MQQDVDGWVRRFRHGCLIALAVSGIPFLVLLAFFRQTNFSGVAMILVGLVGIVVLGAIGCYAFARLWGRAAVEHRMVHFWGDSLRFGNADYQRRFDILNPLRTHTTG